MPASPAPSTVEEEVNITVISSKDLDSLMTSFSRFETGLSVVENGKSIQIHRRKVYLC